MDILPHESEQIPKATRIILEDCNQKSKSTMAAKELALFLAIASSIVFRAANAQTSSCTPSFLSLAPCLAYITGSEAAPAASCCSGLSSVVQTSPQCLCELLKGGSSQFGFTVNQTLALQLPTVCRVQTPPVSACDAASAPAAPTAPATNTSSPGGSSASSPAATGSQTPPVKGTGNGSSGLTPFSAGTIFFFVSTLVGFLAV